MNWSNSIRNSECGGIEGGRKQHLNREVKLSSHNILLILVIHLRIYRDFIYILYYTHKHTHI